MVTYKMQTPTIVKKDISHSTLYQGDCLEVLPLIDNESIDLIYCDLPFGTTQCTWDNIIPFDKMWQQVIRIAKHNTAIVFHAQQPFTSALIMSNPKMFKYSFVWEKSKATGFLNAKKRPLVAHEDIIVFCKGTPVYYPQMTTGEAYNKGVRKKQTDNDIYGKFEQVEVKSEGSRYPRSVQYFKTAESEGKTFHKTEKPIELCKYIINTFSMEGQTVLDFTMGSNKSGLACEILNRKFIGVEKDVEHFTTSINRISVWVLNTKLHINDK
jgi:adenine specific DNA methylase Mod